MAWREGTVQAEWVDGEIIEMAPASAEHQRLGGFLHAFLRAFIEHHGLGEVFYAPFLMRLASRPSGREPDLLFVASTHADRVRDTYLDGPADLVVEIVSPESEVRDRREKFLEYETAGIPEYWLLDVPRRTAHFYVLGVDGRYHEAPVAADGIYTSTVVTGLRLRVSWLWRRPLPTLRDALADLPA
jgi:Uma2 family endonuclease